MKTISEDDLKKIIKLMMIESNTNSFKDIANDLDYKETTFRASITNNSMRFKDFVKVANYLGFDVIIKERSSN